MTKQHFEAIAAQIRQTREECSPLNGPALITGGEDAIDALTARLADEFKRINPRFDRSRFAAACRGEDSRDSAGRRVRYSAR
jgi:7-keto-8-aminopelargonate synthetase-like enzyme